MAPPENQETKAPLLLFVCSGNICRSPMAVGIAADEAQRRRLRLRIASAGTVAMAGDPVEARTQAVMEEIDLSIDWHRAQPVTPELIKEAALVVAMTKRLKQNLQSYVPERAQCIVSFADLTGLGDVPDPYGGDLREFRAVRDQLRAGMDCVLEAAVAAGDAQETA